MKIFFSYCSLPGYIEDSNVKFGIGWYKHYKGHKWWGFTIEFYCYFWLFQANYVSNWIEYDKRLNYYKQPEYIQKQKEKLDRWAKIREELAEKEKEKK